MDLDKCREQWLRVGAKIPIQSAHWLRYELIHPVLDILENQDETIFVAVRAKAHQAIHREKVCKGLLRLGALPQQLLPKADTPDDLAALSAQVWRIRQVNKHLKHLKKPQAEEMP